MVSLSSRTVVYKGMFLVNQLRAFYQDLQDPDYQSALALVHSRFSTNTNPSWERAHPNRLILHNGEINTIRGNADRMLAREETMYSDLLAEDIDKVLPVVNAEGSDSAILDQHPGISHHERHAPSLGRHDHHPRALASQRQHEPGEKGLFTTTTPP